MNMKVQNYDEWKQAVNTERNKLSEVRHYLNENGTERYRVFVTLANLSDFCGSASELLAWIESKEGFTKYDISYLESGHASLPLRSLRKIASQE